MTTTQEKAIVDRTGGTVATMAGDESAIDVVVDRIDTVAENVISVTLKAKDGSLLSPWEPGAHIDLFLDGHLERQYSLCGDPADRSSWEVAVLRDSQSRGGSAWLHTHLHKGDVLRARGPRNNFPLVGSGAYIFVAGGIGITPFVPMIQQAQRRGAEWRLLYVGKKRAAMAFAAQLEAYGSRVTIAAKDEHGAYDLKNLLGTPLPDTVVYCCGPERLISGVEAQCAAWPEGALHAERFRAKPGALDGDSGEFQVVLTKAGITVQVHANESIIDALDKVNIHVPRSCGEGTCGTCLVKVVDGMPDHRDSFLMGKKRRENKHICICCSRALTPSLTLEV